MQPSIKILGVITSRVALSIHTFYNYDTIIKRFIFYRNYFLFSFYVQFGIIKSFFLPYIVNFSFLQKKLSLRFRVLVVRDAQFKLISFYRIKFLGHSLVKNLSNIFFKKKKKKVKKKLFASFININLNPFLLWRSFFLSSGKSDNILLSLTKIFLNVLKNFNCSISVFLLFYFLRTLTFVEVRSVTLRRRRNLVPFLLSLHRQLFVSLKSFLNAILGEKKQARVRTRDAFFIKAFKECKKTLTGTSETLVKLQEIKTLALLNRSNAHYRW